jgi:inner membrane transporter RhtA
MHPDDPHPNAEARLAPEVLFAAGALSQYIGAAIAVGLFDEIDAPGVAWLRVTGAALILLAWRRPSLRAYAPKQWAWIAAFGVALGAMNLCFYLAIEILPLGTAVAIEFAGPIVVAAFGSRTKRAALGVALAAGGVLLLADVTPAGDMRGVFFAMAAGTAWAGYIVFGHQVSAIADNADALALAMGAGALAVGLVGVGPAADATGTPTLLLLALATGLFSNVVPYAIDQVVLRVVTRARFALLQSMLPVVAVFVGIVALDQRPNALETLGVGLVVGALAVSPRRPAARPRTAKTRRID